MMIVLGSTNQDKVKILEEAVPKAEIIACRVDSGITDQPADLEATLKGARNRARNAFEKYPEANLAVGMESGLHDDGQGYFLVTCVCIVDKDGFEYLGEGATIPLPKEVSDKVKAGGWFGGLIREYARVNKIDTNLISRKVPFIQAIQAAFRKVEKSSK
jgi:inosine/xanthosine triphosphatase